MKKILLIDDDKDLLELLEAFLSQTYNVSLASNAFEALVLSRQSCFDLIVTDFRMPIMDGASFLKIIRTENLFTKVVVTSSEEQTLLFEEFAGLDVKKFIRKPFELNQIKLVIDGICKKEVTCA